MEVAVARFGALTAASGSAQTMWTRTVCATVAKKQRRATMKKSKNGDVKCVKTVRYLEALIAYKRTHIRREKERLSELESLLDEVKYIK